MNLNPFAVQAPESVESVLERANATCARFNTGKGLFVGHYLAIGRNDGAVAVCSVETKDVLRYFDGHVKSVTSVSWSPYNRYLASSSLDWNVIIWELGNSIMERAHTLRFDAPVRSVQYCPASSNLLAVCLETQHIILMTLRKRKKYLANGHIDGAITSTSKVHQYEPIEEVRRELKCSNGVEDEMRSVPALSASFTPDGKRIAVGTTKGDILVFDCSSCELLQRFHTGSSGIRELAFDRSGRTLATNCNDRVVRIFNIATTGSPGSEETIDISASHKFQDSVNRTPWLGIGFSADGEYIYGGAAHKIAHNVYVWDRGAGVLDKILQGPRDSLVDVDWHPTRPMIASVSNTGAIYLWFNAPIETWSAYAPGFEELEENIVYEEKEDEFDLEDEEELTRRKQDEEEAYVEIRLHPDRGKRRAHKGKDVENTDDHAIASMALDVGSDDIDDDDDCDEDFIIPVRLSIDLPNFEGES